MQNHVKAFRFSIQALLLAGFFLIQFPLSAQVQAPPEAASPVVGTPGNYILTFRPGTSQADRAASVRRAGAVLRFNYNLVNAAAVTIPNANVFAALQRDISVLEIIPDRPVRAFQAAQGNGNGNGRGPGGGGGGGGSSTQTVPEGVKRVSPCSAANTCSTSGSAIGVAIIDTGVDLAHADLAGGIGDTYSAFGGSCQDDHGHGTHVAGIVGARNNTTDVVGVAPNSTLYCAKVLDATGSGSDATVMAGLDWVAQTDGITRDAQGVCSLPTGSTPPVRVVNMSLGRPGTLDDNTALRASVACLYDNGIVVVVAAGNDSSAEVSQMIPAGYPEVLAIASSTAIDGGNAGCRFFRDTIKADTASYFTTDGMLSAQNIGVTISAPGADKEDVSKSCFASSVGILSLKLGGGTTRMSGTSMAAPHVAGIVARLLQAGNSGVQNIRSTIRSTADRASVAPLDSPTNGYTFDLEREGIAQAPQ